MAFKCILVGDHCVGKNKLAAICSGIIPPGENPPGAVEDQKVSISVDGIKHTINIISTEGSEDYAKLRPLSYPETDIFIVLFSIINYNSYSHVEKLWKPEIKEYCSDAPIILVGSYAEVRKNPEKLNSLAERGITLISQEQGEVMAKRIGAVQYIEWSDSDKDDVDFIFEEAVRACLKKSNEKSTDDKKDKDKRCCNLS
ncbi:GTPase_rho, putative [Entamoeba dispar SAW760]|uniref:small monomeric GTPase n=1 Tax=Entamoeba dispar (strain ATCC PRA-260 / SAW760) TaxID=370354 RepID=B0EUE4_ENTDS|nr:GTPase_rho, putative [Entamoeba dispar SAW760]EDR21850.1 GTPase_rho, putative [Entamoeba dispar SAW760]|eukprot:EDR21850.1 GTPase_rho, putative [Entamoeba dispar SAW760]